MMAGMAAPPPPSAGAIALWPLPLLAGLLPAAAALLALAISVQQGLVPACNPFVDGCISISRAAREGPANPLFRALVLPAAALQGLCWLLAARWLRDLQGPGRGTTALALLGIGAAVALALYGAYLGTDGSVYRLLRRFGTVVYFGFTCLCLLLTGRAVQRAAERGRLALAPLLRHAMQTLATALVLLGLANVLVGALVGVAWDAGVADRAENVTEWWGALTFVVGFVALAAMWRRCGLRASLCASRS